MSDKYSRLFAQYAISAKDIPNETAHEVKKRILDSFGVMYLASHECATKAAKKYSYMFPNPNGSTVFGTNYKTNPEIAGFVNGVMVRCLDFNDTYLSKEPLHPSDMIPGLFAIAEWKKLSGKQLIEAIAIAYEISISLCDAASLRAHGWDHVNYIAIGTVCGVGKLLGLSLEQIEHAISIAVVPHASMRQTRAGELSMWKGMAAANSVRNAIFATLLSMNGITGPYHPFDGEMGFFKQLLKGEIFDDLALESLFKNIPPKKILDTHIKYYPVEYHAQSIVDIVKELHKKIGNPDKIESIHIETFKTAYEIIAKDPEKWSPKTKETADHSIQYITVVGLLDGDVTKYSFDKERLNDPRVKELLLKHTTLEEKSEFTAGYPDGIPNRVTVKTKDGKVYTKEVKYPRGHAKNKMTTEEVIEKFRDNVGSILTKERTENLINIVMNIDKVNNIAKIPPLWII